MSKNPKFQAPVSKKVLTASLALVAKASRELDAVGHMTAVERKRAAKMKRGAHAVIPDIVSLAKKFAVASPGVSLADVVSAEEHAKEIELVLAAAKSLYAKLKDEHLRSSSIAWKYATATYKMLRAAASSDATVAKEIEPVQQWFRPRAPSTKKSKVAKSANATTAKPASTNPVSASNGAGAIVNGAAAAHVAG